MLVERRAALIISTHERARFGGVFDRPGDLFATQCAELWQAMWNLSDDGEHSMEMCELAGALAGFLEMPRIFDALSTADQGQLQPILIQVWKTIAQPDDQISEIVCEPRSAGFDEAVKIAQRLLRSLPSLESLNLDEHLDVSLSLRVCSDMA
jgi:hypothetical protein